MDNETIKIIITAIIAPIVTYGGKKVIDIGTKNHDEECCKTPPLTEHPFFERMKCLRNNIQFSFKLKNKGKEEVFRDILTNKFNIFIERMWRTCEKLEKCGESIDDTAFYNLVMDSLREGVKEYTTYFKHSRVYTQDEIKCIELVMTKFNKWHFSRIDNCIKSIEMIASSKFYTDNHIRMASILDMLLGQFVDTLNDAELTLNELNGDLKGLIFKGIKL